jgi:hypothetical protein
MEYYITTLEANEEKKNMQEKSHMKTAECCKSWSQIEK